MVLAVMEKNLCYIEDTRKIESFLKIFSKLLMDWRALPKKNLEKDFKHIPAKKFSFTKNLKFWAETNLILHIPTRKTSEASLFPSLCTKLNVFLNISILYNSILRHSFIFYFDIIGLEKKTKLFSSSLRAFVF